MGSLLLLCTAVTFISLAETQFIRGGLLGPALFDSKEGRNLLDNGRSSRNQRGSRTQSVSSRNRGNQESWSGSQSSLMEFQDSVRFENGKRIPNRRRQRNRGNSSDRNQNNNRRNRRRQQRARPRRQQRGEQANIPPFTDFGSQNAVDQQVIDSQLAAPLPMSFPDINNNMFMPGSINDDRVLVGQGGDPFQGPNFGGAFAAPAPFQPANFNLPSMAPNVFQFPNRASNFGETPSGQVFENNRGTTDFVTLSTSTPDFLTPADTRGLSVEGDEVDVPNPVLQS
ncbi:uncharacterized protein [Watersipora subatra]|uniref:uncharacterized protein n=1 Tax=Watersipora subatra TaxID=2589382 RepID=UPI00355BD604